MSKTYRNEANGNEFEATLQTLERLSVLAVQRNERAYYKARFESVMSYRIKSRKQRRTVAANHRQAQAKVNLLTIENAKTKKGESLGFITGILYLAPAFESGVLNTCPAASDGCRADCLYTAGRGRFDEIKQARIKKTLAYAKDKNAFIETLAENIARLVRKAEKQGKRAAVRLNGTSDIPSLARTLARRFPSVQFYDYTKLPKPQTRILPNYHLTFSRSESNSVAVFDALENGINVAVVFDTVKGAALPSTWKGFRVIDGDNHDLRFLDEKGENGRGLIVGLHAKGKAIYAQNSFVVKDEVNGRAARKAKGDRLSGKSNKERRLDAIVKDVFVNHKTLTNAQTESLFQGTY